MFHCAPPPSVPPRQLRPFLPDRKLPQDQEFMVISAREPQLFLRQWSSGPQHSQDFSFSTQLECKLLEYRNLTHLQLLQPTLLQVGSLLTSPSRTEVSVRLQAGLSELFCVCVFQGQAAATCCPQNTTLDVNVFLDPVLLNISQFAIHTVDAALHSWKQVTHFNL